MPATADQSKPASAAAPASDPLGRNTPRGTVVGFLSAVQRREFERAAEFLGTHRQGAALEELSDQLAFVINSAGLGRLSDAPEGTAQEGLSRGIERLGTVRAGDGTINLDLSRVQHGTDWIWVFSEQTLRRIPGAYEQLRNTPVNSAMPALLTEPLWLSVPLWKYLTLVAGSLLAMVATYALRRVLGRFMIRRFQDHPLPNRDRLATRLTRLARPLGILIWLVLTEAIVSASALPLLARQIWYSIATKLAVAAITWLILGIVHISSLVYRWRMEQSGRAELTAVVRLAQRTIDLLCVTVAVLVVLRLSGYDASTLLAGLGLGGVALAFAAQKTLENLFGGVSMVLDRPIRVGDDCRIGDRVATVLDIGMRSTRLRTLDRTLMTIPNGQLAAMTLDNLSMRDSICFHHVLGVRIESAARKLEQLLEALRALLAEHPMVDPAAPRVRLIRLDAQAFDIELFCYIRTQMMPEFLAVQEALLLRSLRILDEQGASLASPLRTIVLAKGSADAATEGAVTGSTSVVPRPE